MAAAVLGVERSVRGRRWTDRRPAGPAGERAALAIAQRHGLPDLAARVLAARGVGVEEAGDFLEPKLRASLPDPLRLKGMAEGAARLARAVEAGETIGIFADYDVDGATSAALLSRFLAAAGARTEVYVPDRIREGYGPTAAALLGLRARGATVAATLDCGIVAFEALEAAAGAGLDVVVVDHHMAEPALPRAAAVVDPNRLDEDGSLGHLAAVGVTFLLVVALNRALREAGRWRGRPEPNPLAWLDLVALGTVCDVVPLRGLNRVFVAQGLKAMALRRNPGLRALADTARLDRRPDAWHLGFVLGPRVNAGGRVGDSALGARLLATEDEDEARRLAGALERSNEERKAVEARVLEEAAAQAEAANDGGPAVVAGEGWHPGVIGIVAGRLRERYGRPACVVALDGAAGKGSGRSVPGLDLGAAVIAARQAGLLSAGGGHAMAAGFAIARDRLDAFRAFLAERFAAEAGAGARPVAELGVDGVLAPAGARRATVDALSRLGPFGSGHPEPRFAVADARVARADPVGESHVRCVFSGADGGRLKGIAFRAMEDGLGPALLKHGGRRLHLAGHLRPDDWRGREDVQLVVEDAARAD